MSPAIRGATLALALGLWPGLTWAAPLTADDVVRFSLEHHPDLVAARGAVATHARVAYVHARAADERARLADEGLDQAGRLRAALEDRGRAGEASPLDVRLHDAVDRLGDVDAREARSLARLDAMLAVESDPLLPIASAAGGTPVGGEEAR